MNVRKLVCQYKSATFVSSSMTPPKNRRTVLCVIIAVVCMALVLFGISALVPMLQDRLCFSPKKQTLDGITRFRPTGFVVEDVFLRSDKEVLHGWFMHGVRSGADTPDVAQPLPLVLYYHGNSGHVGYYAAMMKQYARHGFDVLCVDYRGFGTSSGTPTEQSLYRDADHIADFALKLVSGDSKRLIVVGYSMGSAAATHAVASRLDAQGVRALVLETPFAVIKDVITHKLPLTTPLYGFMSNAFNNLERASRITQTPVAVIHSPQDELIPFEDAVRVFDAVQSAEKVFIPSYIGAHVAVHADARLFQWLQKLPK